MTIDGVLSVQGGIGDLEKQALRIMWV